MLYTMFVPLYSLLSQSACVQPHRVPHPLPNVSGGRRGLTLLISSLCTPPHLPPSLPPYSSTPPSLSTSLPPSFSRLTIFSPFLSLLDSPHPPPPPPPQSPIASVTGIHSRQRSKWRPLPLDTVVSATTFGPFKTAQILFLADLFECLPTICLALHRVVHTLYMCGYVYTQELEKQASRKLRINAKETMRIAEKLYTQG